MKGKWFSVGSIGCLVLLIVALLLVGGYPAHSQDKPQYGGILRVVEGAGPRGCIGWPANAVGNDALGMKPCIEYLVNQDNMNKILPCLATDWKVARDRKSITFTLRKGVKFHDGSDFNAEVARFNLQAVKDAKASGTASWTSVEVVDDYTVRINLSEYNNNLLARLSGSPGAMVSKEAVEKNGIEWAKLNPVGTGPFKFVSFQRDVVAKYTRNENYWDKGKPYLDGVELHFIKDPMTQQAVMRAGEAEVLGIGLGKMAADMKALGFKIISAPSGTVSLLPDSKNADSPFGNKKVREAVEYAIDREAIVKGKGYGFLKAAYQLPPSNSMAYDPNFKGRQYDPEKAKKLLTETGYPNGFATKIIPMSFDVDRDVMVALQSYLGEVGIKVDLDFVDYGRYSEYRRKGWHNALLCQPIAVFPNYNQTLDFYFSAKSPDFPSLARPAGFDELIQKSISTVEAKKRNIQNVLEKMFDETMVIPINEVGRGYAVQNYVHDTGHLEWGSWTNWTPDRAWMSK
ncbi:MAG: ABC transporter substrate-binding protein [Deltaproteobacteria bacterium]|nr:ABC transporter substrate-binding protein [Deltaproteobacteria bacterium]